LNHLNSILLEGVIEDQITFSDEKAFFAIVSNRFLKNKDEKFEKETTTVPVVVGGSNFVSVVREEGHKGRGMRVVGRIAERMTGLYIEAEHIEFRPDFAKAAEEKENTDEEG